MNSIRIKIKKLVKGNIYLNKILYSIYGVKRNRKINNITVATEKMDTIESIKEFSEIVYKAQNDSQLLFSYGVENENNYYGHAPNILAYAGKSNNYRPFLPNIQHGVMFVETYNNDMGLDRYACMIPDENKRKVLRKYSYARPIFTIGPYIHYAKHYYNENIIKNMKDCLGKTLLIFPIHSTEYGEALYSEEALIKFVLSISKEFNSIYACVHWRDINSDLAHLLQKNNIKVVSAGWRYDRQFLNRLKTIIELSDVVIGNDIGTNIGYCLYMNKPYFIYDSNVKVVEKGLEESDEYREEREKILKAFSWERPDYKAQKDIYETYWSPSHIKTTEEMAAIIEIGKDIVRGSYGFINKCEDVTRLKLKTYSESSNEFERLKYKLLSESLG